MLRPLTFPCTFSVLLLLLFLLAGRQVFICSALAAATTKRIPHSRQLHMKLFGRNSPSLNTNWQLKSSNQEYRIEKKKFVDEDYNVFENILSILMDMFRAILYILKPMLLFNNRLFRRDEPERVKLSIPRLKELLKYEEIEAARGYYKKQFDTVRTCVPYVPYHIPAP